MRGNATIQNGFVESFNGRVIDYNTNRPHTSLNGLTPAEFATRTHMDENKNIFYL